MNSFDLTILAIFLTFTLLGAWRGLVREVMSVLTWILSFFLAWFFADQLAPSFNEILGDPALRQLAAFVIIFIVVFAIGTVISWFGHKFLPPLPLLLLVNTALGGVFGALRGAVIVIALFLVAGLTSFPRQNWWREATLTPFFEQAAVYVAEFIPRDIARHIRYG